ncbi:MAG: hypothetical protein A2Y12_04680 [Planctomycetes bacterium GWF2_42_9]|nr:MAG: hypothetical protein A2Y12_04680 [Planctomycetes bacterium GWF2_42_9]
MQKVLLIACLLVLSGCASTPTQEEMLNADYGECPQNYEQTIKNIMAMRLRDPDSAQYRFEQPFRGWADKGLINGGGKEFGWVVKVAVNGKNGYGGYTGFQPFAFLFRGENMVREIWVMQ